MSEKDESPRLIVTPLSAAIAVGLAGFLAAQRVLVILAHGDPRPHWIHEFDEVLPQFTRIALHTLIYAVATAGLVQAVRELKGADRLYCVLLLADVLLYPCRIYLPAPAPRFILWLETLANIVMLFAAIRISIQLARKKNSTAPDP